MRFWYVAKRRQTVLDATILTLFGAALLSILVWLLPREDQFHTLLGRNQTDLVALRYAQLMVQRDPDNYELRYLLGKQYANLGRFKDALAELSRIERLNRTPTIKFLMLEILQKLYFGMSSATEKRLWRKEIEYALADLSAFPTLSNPQRRLLAENALGFGIPLLAAQQYAQLAASGEPNALLDAGQFALQAGNPGEAAKYFRQALLENPRSKSIWQHALSAFAGANRMDAGADLIAQALRQGHILPDTVLIAGRFLQAANRIQVLGELIRQSADMPLPAHELAQWMTMAIAAGQIELGAQRVPELLAAYPSKATVRLQAAQLLNWTNRAPEALEHWQWLAEHAPSMADQENTWRMAQVLWRHDVVAKMIADTAVDRVLTTTEREALIEAHLKLGEPLAALAVLRSHLDTESQDIAAWRLGATILAEDEQQAAALDWYQQMSEHTALTAQDHIQMAKLYWQQFRLQEALAALNQVPADFVSQDAEYWSWVAQLAWEQGEYERANQALLAFAQINELNKTQFDMLLASLGDNQRDERRLFAVEAWRVLAEPRYLLTALLDAFDDDDAEFEKLMAHALSNLAAFEKSPIFWILKARHHQRHNQTDQAWLAFARANELNPSDPVTVGSVLWFLIDEKRADLLNTYLASKVQLATTTPSLAHPVDAAYALLNRPKQASYWYQQALLNQPDSTRIALELADALGASGQVDGGWRMRRHILQRALSQDYAFSDLDASVIQRASLSLLTAPQFGQVLLGMLERDKAGVLNGLMTGLLQTGHIEGLLSLRNLAHAHGVRVDPYVNYYIALQQRDLNKLNEYRTYPDAPIKVEALIAMRELPSALHESLLGINDVQPEFYRRQLRRIAADLMHEDPYGWQTYLQQRDLGGIELTAQTLRFARPWRNWHLDSKVQRSEFDTLDTLILAPGQSQLFDQTHWQFNAERIVEDGKWTLATLAVQSTVEDWVGLHAKRSWHIDNKLRTQASVSYAAIAEQTPLLQIFGKNHQLNGRLTHNLSPVDVWSASLDINQFTDRFGDKLGSGFELELNYDHALFSNAPALLLRANLYWMKNQRDTFGAPLSNLLGQRDPNDLLPLDTGRASVGAILERGDPMRLNRRLPSPHYRVAVSTGFQWPSGSTTLNLEASLGIRVLGDDLLAVKFAYESQPLTVQGSSGVNWSLIYSRRLGK